MQLIQNFKKVKIMSTTKTSNLFISTKKNTKKNISKGQAIIEKAGTHQTWVAIKVEKLKS